MRFSILLGNLVHDLDIFSTLVGRPTISTASTAKAVSPGSTAHFHEIRHRDQLGHMPCHGLLYMSDLDPVK